MDATIIGNGKLSVLFALITCSCNICMQMNVIFKTVLFIRKITISLLSIMYISLFLIFLLLFFHYLIRFKAQI